MHKNIRMPGRGVQTLGMGDSLSLRVLAMECTLTSTCIRMRSLRVLALDCALHSMGDSLSFRVLALECTDFHMHKNGFIEGPCSGLLCTAWGTLFH